jgi:hypothetical protein
MKPWRLTFVKVRKLITLILLIAAIVCQRVGSHYESLANRPGIGSGAAWTRATQFQSEWYDWGIILGLAFGLFLIYPTVHGVIGETFEAAQVAATPVPDPLYVAQQLRVEWGREPSVVEVAAVHQMLCTQRNQAALDAGIGIAGLFLLHDAAERAKVRQA